MELESLRFKQQYKGDPAGLIGWDSAPLKILGTHYVPAYAIIASVSSSGTLGAALEHGDYS